MIITSFSFQVPGVKKPGHVATWANENITGRNVYCQHLSGEHFSVSSPGATEDLSAALRDLQANADLINRQFC